MNSLGFVGTGVITAHMVRGLKASVLRDWPVVLSPRSAGTAQALARLPGVRVAADNQAVVDAAEVLVLAVRPQIAEEVLSGLSFHPDRPIISLMAGVSLEDLARWTAGRDICRAIPLPPVEVLRCVTPVYPPRPLAMQLFNALGQALPVHDLPAFDAYGTGSAVMATWFGLAETVAGWMQAHGIDEADAQTYVRGLFGNLGDTLRASDRPIEALRHDHATKGGLNEQTYEVFRAKGGSAAVIAGMDAVMARITGKT